MMGRCFAVALTLATIAQPAFAGIGGEIAYSLRGGRDIYLINPDGTGQRTVYRGAAKREAHVLSVKPNGGLLAVEEVVNSQSRILKLVSYTESGIGQVSREISGCFFNASIAANGDVLYVDWCDHSLKYLPSGASSATTLAATGSVDKVSWLSDGSFVYAASGGLYHGTLNNSAGTQIANLNCVQSLHAAHQSPEALAQVGQACPTFGIYRAAVDPPSLGSKLTEGYSASYSQDDECFLYITPAARGGAYLTIRRFDGPASAQVGRKANYGTAVWRGDSSPSACPVQPTNSAFDFRVPPR